MLRLIGKTFQSDICYQPFLKAKMSIKFQFLIVVKGTEQEYYDYKPIPRKLRG